MATLNETPGSNRLHIGIFGKTNSGKSSLINAFTHQDVSIVADVAGTTTDPVYKAMEINPLGPCVLIDTAGFDDDSRLGARRVDKTLLAADKTDIAVIVMSGNDSLHEKAPELEWLSLFRKKKTPFIFLVNKTDIYPAESEKLAEHIREKTGASPVMASCKSGKGIEELKKALVERMPENFGEDFITGSLVSENDLVMLVMPQDIQAPKGRLILPQVQTLRELLDKKCMVMSVTTDKLLPALEALSQPPKLIITDSQVFDYVYNNKPAESMLTSFSVLFAAYKGDLAYYIRGAETIDRLTEKSKVLIAECCTHAPLEEDIGRVKIPRMLRKKAGEGLTVDIVSGTDFPTDLSNYDLIIQCGACMFNRKYVLARIEKAREQNVPVTNYGIAIAHIKGILDKIATG